MFISFRLMGIIVLIILGVLVVPPALNDIAIQSAQCTVLSSEYTNEDVSCDCGRYCTSSYPCLQIRVSYIAKGKTQTAYLHKDVYVDKNKCSIQSCYSDSSINYIVTKQFKTKYGDAGQSYTCYYNPKTPDEVFANRESLSSDKVKIMHYILWPFVFVFFCGAMLVGILFCQSKGHCCFKKGSWGSVPYQDL